MKNAHLHPASSPSRLPHSKMSHERKVLLLALLSGLPGSLVAFGLLYADGHSARLGWTLSILILILWFGFAFALREKVVMPLQTVSNLLAALREEDYSIRARGARSNDALGEVMREVNALGETLRERRIDATDATSLLRVVMAEIDIALFTFDSDLKVQLVNPAGERLMASSFEKLRGQSAAELGLLACLQAEEAATVQLAFPGRGGRWAVRRSIFREHGWPHQILLLTDLSRALREEERQAWKRLVRVLGHELNNSLTPIRSIACSLEDILRRNPRPADWDEDLRRGLAVISARSEALGRFMQAYSQVARLPQPELESLDIAPLVRRVAALETRLQVELKEGPQVWLRADGDQLEQLLINLLRNAVDASLETGGGVRVAWQKAFSYIEISIEDEGLGLSETANLFVPFYTTKPNGSGIGLVLSRQIAEAHGGSLTLANRADQRGCRAELRLPL